MIRLFLWWVDQFWNGGRAEDPAVQSILRQFRERNVQNPKYKLIQAILEADL